MWPTLPHYSLYSSGLKPNPQYFTDIKTENGPQVPSEEDYYIMQCSRAVKKEQKNSDPTQKPKDILLSEGEKIQETV